MCEHLSEHQDAVLATATGIRISFEVLGTLPTVQDRLVDEARFLEILRRRWRE